MNTQIKMHNGGLINRALDNTMSVSPLIYYYYLNLELFFMAFY